MGLKITLNNGVSDLSLGDYAMEGTPSGLTMRVEGSEPGAPGVVSLDSCDFEFPESELDGNFDESTLYAKKAAGTWYTIKVEYNMSGTDRELFYGLVDYDSIEYTDAETVKFKALDQLYKVKLLAKEDVRTQGTLSDSGYYYYLHHNAADETFIYISKWDDTTGNSVDFPVADQFDAGQIIIHGSEYLFITKSEIVDYNNGDAIKKANKLTLHRDYTGEGIAKNTIDYYNKEIYGYDINITSGGVVIAIAARQLAQYILLKAFPGATINTDLPNTYYLNLDHYEHIGVGNYEKKILGYHPQEALKQIVRGLQAYLWMDSTGAVNLYSKPTSAPAADLTITKDDCEKWSSRYAWNKRVDMIALTAELGDGTTETANYPDSYDEESSNSYAVTVYKPQNITMAEMAEDIWEFYGKRHLGAKVTLKFSDSLLAALSILMTVSFESAMYFVDVISIDIAAMTVTLEMASYQTWDN